LKKTAILIGSKPASIVALLLLIRNNWEVKEVVASKDQPSWIEGPSLGEVSSSLGIRTVENQDHLISENVDLVISYMSRVKIKPNTLSRAKYPLNFHAGPLPEFGGWAFYNVAILEDSYEYGCSCHVMDESFDTGPIVKVRRFSINPKIETAYSLEKKSQVEMLLLFSEILSMYDTGRSLPKKDQIKSKMRYMNSQQFKALKEIPPNANAEDADRIARAFWYPPYEMAYIKTLSGVKLEVIPEIVKSDLATGLHAEDLKDLLKLNGLKLPTKLNN